MIAGLKACDVTAVELCRVHVDFGDVGKHREIVRQYHTAGISIDSIGVETLYGDRQQERPIFEFARLAGAGFISVHFTPESSPESWHTAAEMAEEFDLKLCVHNHGGRHWLGSKQMLEYLLSATSQRIGLCLDTAWALDAGEDPNEMAEKLSQHLFGVHIKDFVFDRGRKPQDVVVGTGNLALDVLLKQVASNSNVGYIVIEYEGDVENPIPALQRCVEQVRSHLLGAAP